MPVKRYWKNEREYIRIMEILEDYWLTEPDEKYVGIRMHFEKADGQTQDKLIQWWNPNMDHGDNYGEIVNLADVWDEIV